MLSPTTDSLLHHPQLDSLCVEQGSNFSTTPSLWVVQLVSCGTSACFGSWNSSLTACAPGAVNCELINPNISTVAVPETYNADFKYRCDMLRCALRCAMCVRHAVHSEPLLQRGASVSRTIVVVPHCCAAQQRLMLCSCYLLCSIDNAYDTINSQVLYYWAGCYYLGSTRWFVAESSFAVGAPTLRNPPSPPMPPPR